MLIFLVTDKLSQLMNQLARCKPVFAVESCALFAQGMLFVEIMVTVQRLSKICQFKAKNMSLQVTVLAPPCVTRH